VIELGADLSMAFLLVLTMTWCVLLYRRLDRLRVERRDIEAFVTAIDTASQRAEAAIAGIRDSAAEAQRALAGQKELAQARSAELNRLVDSAGRMARRVEAALHQGARSMADGGRHGEAAKGSLSAAVVAREPARPAASRSEPAALDPELLRALEALR
jgi:hypothetical protein